VIAKLAIYGATLGIGILLISPSLDAMLEVTEAGGLADGGARSTLIAAAGVQVVILIGAATLGVFKPGGPRRTRRRAGADSSAETSVLNR
jgi:hypothetical protein